MAIFDSGDGLSSRNAKYWDDAALRGSLRATVSSDPVRGAIAQWESYPSELGHVAYVEYVQRDAQGKVLWIATSESGWQGGTGYSSRKYYNSTDSLYKSARFILPAGVVPTPNPAGTSSEPQFATSGQIAVYWSSGANAVTLGRPVASQVTWNAGGVSGLYQNFEGGMVMSSTVTGTYAVLHGPIRDQWGSAGGSGGTYGWPIADQVVVDGVVSQQFQHGTLVVP